MSRNVRNALAVMAAVIATTTMAPTASAAPLSRDADPCSGLRRGYFVDGPDAKYQHCGPTKVNIQLYLSHGVSPGPIACVGPWSENYLGSANYVVWAKYVSICER